jgi:hypothetical protein
MSKRKRNVFDNDRRMELRMRVAIKKMRQNEVVDPSTLPLLAQPEQKTVERVINKVRTL